MTLLKQFFDAGDGVSYSNGILFFAGLCSLEQTMEHLIRLTTGSKAKESWIDLREAVHMSTIVKFLQNCLLSRSSFVLA